MIRSVKSYKILYNLHKVKNIWHQYIFREVNSGFFYKSAAEREKLVQAERAFIDARVQKIIDLKKKVCDGNNKGFVVINQKVSYNHYFGVLMLFMIYLYLMAALYLIYERNVHTEDKAT